MKECIPTDHAETQLLQVNIQVPDAVNSLNAEHSNSCNFRVVWLACFSLFILPLYITLRLLIAFDF